MVYKQQVPAHVLKMMRSLAIDDNITIGELRAMEELCFTEILVNFNGLSDILIAAGERIDEWGEKECRTNFRRPKVNDSAEDRERVLLQGPALDQDQGMVMEPLITMYQGLEQAAKSWTGDCHRTLHPGHPP